MPYGYISSFSQNYPNQSRKLQHDFSGEIEMRQLVILCLMVFTLSLTGCAPAVISPVPLKAVAQMPTEYRIQPGDQLDIKFFYNSELNESVPVRPDGRISLQLANEIMVAGLTPAELTALLIKNYSKEIDKPEITVIVRTFNSQRVYVDGEVTRAGSVVLTDPMTVMQAISQVGGLKESARANEVIVVRKGSDNKFVSTVVDLEKVINGSDIEQDIVLKPYDIVYVPKSPIANVNLWIDQYIRRNIPLPIGLGLGINY